MRMIRVPAQLRLVDDDDEIIIRPAKPSHASPVLCREWNPGAPAVREVAADLAGTDGVADRSYFSGARTVTLDLMIFGSQYESPYAYLERLAAMAHPSRRPYLYLLRDNGEEWRIQLRGDPFSVTYDRLAGARLEVQLVFSAPSGLFESPERTTATSTVAERGLGQVWPETWPENFGSSGSAIAPLTMNVQSSVPIEPTMRIYGQSTGPAISLDSGPKFVFRPDYTIYDGQYVEIDMRAGTVLLNGQLGASMFNQVDWTKSTFWRIPKGTATVAFVGTGGLLNIYWRDRRLTA